jgi:hypothetical protein
LSRADLSDNLKVFAVGARFYDARSGLQRWRPDVCFGPDSHQGADIELGPLGAQQPTSPLFDDDLIAKRASLLLRLSALAELNSQKKMTLCEQPLGGERTENQTCLIFTLPVYLSCESSAHET